jgi:hypothetical protein
MSDPLGVRGANINTSNAAAHSRAKPTKYMAIRLETGQLPAGCRRDNAPQSWQYRPVQIARKSIFLIIKYLRHRVTKVLAALAHKQTAYRYCIWLFVSRYAASMMSQWRPFKFFPVASL